MTGHIATLVGTDGTITAGIQASCTYTFTQATFVGDWDQLVADFGAGQPITVSFQRVPDQFVARVVRRVVD